MQSKTWSRVEALFQAVRAQPPKERAEFLARACSGDTELRSEVESLLLQADDSFLERSPFSGVESPSPPLPSGKLLGHFEIIRVLARGGMGQVYRARDIRLERDVALKVLRPEFSQDRDRLARFEQEARAASALNHPNIVSVFDAGSTDSVFWIATELVEGETLAELIARGPIPLFRVLEIACQIASGLAAAHASGVVHRDLKPANLMLTRDGRVKILDFGLAKHSGRAASAAPELKATQSMTLPGMLMGTPSYMSPEQVRGEIADARSDLFSLGAILYEMTVGRRPFSGDSSVAVMNSILKDEPPDLPADVNPVFARIVRRCLEKDPAQRFQSAADLQFALEWSDALRPLPTLGASKRKWGWAAAAGLLCVLTGAGGYWFGAYLSSTPSYAGEILRQITFDHGLTADPAISRDGKFVAFASDRAGLGNLDVWLKQIDGGDPVALTNDPANEYDPAFSPDGTRIAFTSEREGGGVYLIPALGGEPSLVARKASRPRFSPDGNYLLYITGVPPQRIGMSAAGNRVFAMPLSGGSPIELSKGCSIVDNSPVWSPDGRRVLFPGMCGGRWDIWSSDLKGDSPSSIRWASYQSRFHLDDFAHSGAGLEGWLDHPVRLLIHFRAGTADFLLAAPTHADGTPIFRPPERITFGTGAETQASVAANGRIAIGSLAYEAHIWGVPMDGSGRATGKARQLTSEFPGESSPRLSADGRHLLFLSSKSVPPQLYGKDLVTGRQRRLSQGQAQVKMSAAMDRSGSTVYYQDDSEDRDVLYSVPFTGGVPQQLSTGQHAIPLDWASNGQALLLHHFPPSGHFSIAVAGPDGKGARPLVTDPGRDIFQAHFSPDARWIAFTVLDHTSSQVFIAPFHDGTIPASEWRPIASGGAWDDKPRFSVDGLTVLFTSDRDGFRCIWGQRLTPDMRPTGDPFAVFHSHDPHISIRNSPVSDAEISVGKGWVVFDQTEFKGNLWVMEPPGWQGPR